MEVLCFYNRDCNFSQKSESNSESLSNLNGMNNSWVVRLLIANEKKFLEISVPKQIEEYSMLEFVEVGNSIEEVVVVEEPSALVVVHRLVEVVEFEGLELDFGLEGHCK